MSKIYKPQPISGFPEWSPELRALELSWLDHIRRVFESYGFCNIETPAVEVLDVLLAKGEVENEIYTLHRLQADEKDKTDARLALRFDNTVPFARYTAQHFNNLTFPFKRYQMQKVWRGERPQEGRYREFYQCDIDVINPDNLPLHFDAEIPAVIDEIMQALQLPAYTIYINNRKILIGYIQALGLEAQASAILRIVDKRDKIGEDGVIRELTQNLKLDDALAQKTLGLAKIRGNDANVIKQAKALGISNPMFDEGLEELAYVLNSLQGFVGNRVMADLSIVRGLDYYTGTVYETKFNDYPEIGTIIAGGRYEDLASSYINKKLPGIGISIGLTRLLGVLIGRDMVKPLRNSPTDVLITQMDETQRNDALSLAKILRARGFNVEVYHNATKIQKQLAYADKKQIPYVWFLSNSDQPQHQVKDMAAGTQSDADPQNWSPAK
ncbi:MAG TPA: histidine--tRNA ligase [Alphaproteobacteria bacterium]